MTDSNMVSSRQKPPTHLKGHDAVHIICSCGHRWSAALSCQILLTWALGLLQADLGASALALALYSGSFLPFSPFITVPARMHVM